MTTKALFEAMPKVISAGRTWRPIEVPGEFASDTNLTFLSAIEELTPASVDQHSGTDRALTQAWREQVISGAMENGKLSVMNGWIFEASQSSVDKFKRSCNRAKAYNTVYREKVFEEEYIESAVLFHEQIRILILGKRRKRKRHVDIAEKKDVRRSCCEETADEVEKLENKEKKKKKIRSLHFDVLSGRLAQFVYDSDTGLALEPWYRRHKDVFTVNGAPLGDATRVRLLLQKLNAPICEKCVCASYILPRTPCGTVTHAERADRDCVNFRLWACTEDQFKCLIFVCGLQSGDDKFIRLKLLDKIEADTTCTVKKLTKKCERLLNLKQ
ncbi:unnamed protein product [Toxocara canis]|uniref:SET domain-containing protein n=1 Tax=Toxocara canis TaxID=6265 RepID=A0A183US24_TOXCA|nr:unnamed protein product [Toxocara canis]